MTAALAGAVATAGVLGVTHAIEPDHVAGIASLTGEFGDRRISALAGACFSLGHVALVVLWLGVAYALLERTAFSPAADAAGTTGAGLLLAVLGGALAVGGARSLRHDHDHDRDPHVHLPLAGVVEPGHGVRGYLATGLVGALFTLSPPLSMIAFSATLLPDHGPGAIALAVAVYAVAITATMSALGAGAGTLFGLAETRGHRLHGGAQLLAGVLVVGLAATMLLDAVPALL